MHRDERPDAKKRESLEQHEDDRAECPGNPRVAHHARCGLGWRLRSEDLGPPDAGNAGTSVTPIATTMQRGDTWGVTGPNHTRVSPVRAVEVDSARVDEVVTIRHVRIKYGDAAP